MKGLIPMSNCTKCTAKPDYEAKAKAFDAILKAYDESLSEGHMADEVCNIIEKYESGGSDD